MLLPKINKGGYSLPQSFAFAVKGICYAVKSERNLRIHLAAAAYVMFLAFRYYNLAPGEYALLLLVIGLVVTCELFNTAIETAVDTKTPGYSGLAKITKDVAAGAVLVSSLTAFTVGLFLLWDIEIFEEIIYSQADNFLLWLIAFAVTAVWVIWPRAKR